MCLFRYLGHSILPILLFDRPLHGSEAQSPAFGLLPRAMFAMLIAFFCNILLGMLISSVEVGLRGGWLGGGFSSGGGGGI